MTHNVQILMVTSVKIVHQVAMIHLMMAQIMMVMDIVMQVMTMMIMILV